jgi:serine/threonine protein kinase
MGEEMKTLTEAEIGCALDRQKAMSNYKTKVSKDVLVEDGTIYLNRKPIERFEISGILGKGVNGVVFDAHHRVLNQPRAVKVWMKLGGVDKRNKVTQGIAEAQKIAASDPKWVVMVYDAEVAGDFLYSSMEKIIGKTLGEELRESADLFNRWCLAGQYVDAIKNTTTETLYHGDAHTGNVMVYRDGDEYGTYTKMKLLDFGTSIYSGKEASKARHWRIVYETFLRIIEPFKSKDWALVQSIPYNNREDNLLRWAYFRDVLDGLKIEAGVLGKPGEKPVLI